MNRKKTAILVDGGFLEKSIFKKQKLDVQEVYTYAKKFIEPEEDLFRIYYYDCYPYDTTSELPISKTERNYAETPICKEKNRFLDKFAKKEYVALRKGRLAFQGWRLKNTTINNILEKINNKISIDDEITDNDFVPIFKQKAVDMKIGLDVAWLASKRIVDRILLITADTDFIPALKFARKEGVQVFICSQKDVRIHPELIEHSDGLRNK